MNYEDYLKTPQWAELKRQAKERDGHRCVLCNRGQLLQVHHRTYEHIGGESIDDLSTLCDPCHDLYTAAGKVKKPPSGQWVDILPAPQHAPMRQEDREGRLVYELLAFVLAFPSTSEIVDDMGAYAYVLDPGLSEMVRRVGMGDGIEIDPELTSMISSFKSIKINDPARGVRETLAALRIDWLERKLVSLEVAIQGAKDAGDTDGRRGLIEQLLAVRLERDETKNSIAKGELASNSTQIRPDQQGRAR